MVHQPLERISGVSIFIQIKKKNNKNSLLTIVRLKLTVHEMWHEQFVDRESMEFKNFAENLRSAVSEIYEDNLNEANSIDANLIDVQ